MDYQEFKRDLMEVLSEKMEREVKLSFRQIPKNNGIMWEAIVIEKKEENISPIIYIQEYFEFWRKGVTMEQIVEKILWSCTQCEPRVRLTQEIFQNYDKMKNHIYYKVINYERNREQLKDVPYKRILDLAMVFYYEMEDSQFPSTVTIRNSHLKMWNISQEELEMNAKKYTCLNKPAEFITMDEIAHIEEEEFSDILEEDSLPMYVLTNKQKMFGAGVIFYPGMLELAESILGDHFYILPSSVHECILVPERGNYTQEELVSMVTEINEEHVEPGDVLADQAYYYLKKDKKIHT